MVFSRQSNFLGLAGNPATIKKDTPLRRGAAPILPWMELSSDGMSCQAGIAITFDSSSGDEYTIEDSPISFYGREEPG